MQSSSKTPNSSKSAILPRESHAVIRSWMSFFSISVLNSFIRHSRPIHIVRSIISPQWNVTHNILITGWWYRCWASPGVTCVLLHISLEVRPLHCNSARQAHTGNRRHWIALVGDSRKPAALDTMFTQWCVRISVDCCFGQQMCLPISQRPLRVSKRTNEKIKIIIKESFSHPILHGLQWWV